jgi:hypothetical protein
MYYPEANILVPRHLDPASRTPAFKNVIVAVSPVDRSLAAYPAAVNGDRPTEPVASTRDQMRAC